MYPSNPFASPARASFGTPVGLTAGAFQPYALARCSIPFIALSSGSVAANGAISAITALPIVYPKAFCYFPANILAASIVAGWHYCTFSTTTAGTAFLNTYSSGVPAIPSATTAVTAGQGAFTGDTGEEFGPTITVPANALGTNGELLIGFGTNQTNNANAKTFRARFSGTSGTVFALSTLTSLAMCGGLVGIGNTGSASAQISVAYGAVAFNPVVSILGTIDTTAATTLVLSLQRAIATDNIILEAFDIQMLYRA